MLNKIFSSYTINALYEILSECQQEKDLSGERFIFSEIDRRTKIIEDPRPYIKTRTENILGFKESDMRSYIIDTPSLLQCCDPFIYLIQIYLEFNKIPYKWIEDDEAMDFATIDINHRFSIKVENSRSRNDIPMDLEKVFYIKSSYYSPDYCLYDSHISLTTPVAVVNLLHLPGENMPFETKNIEYIKKL